MFERPKGSKNYWSAFSYQGQEYRKFSEKNNARQGFFEQEEFEMMVSLLPPYLKDMTRFAYHTGWRKTEILTLEWRNIHGDVIRLGPEIAKNKDGRVLVIVGELANILARRQAERVESCPYVFHGRACGSSITIGPGIRLGKKPGCQGSSFTMRREQRCAIWTGRGVPRQTAKQISGDKTDAVYNRYRIVNE